MSEAVKPRQRLMSGARPTNRLHIGNYFGAIRNWIRLQEEYECYFEVADWHALTDYYKTPHEVTERCRDLVAEWVAWGIDPEKHTIFIQSAVPEILQVHMIFSNITPMGWLERVTTWKDAQEELEQKDARNLGRFAYPVLQTADIVAFEGHKVPVGQDQVPHLELSREIVRRFNHLYKGNLPEPGHILSETPLVVGSDGRKMSKSYDNFIPLTPEEDELKKITRNMVTDPKRVKRTDPGDPFICPVYKTHKLFSSEEDLKWVVEGCQTAGIGCGDCKGRLAQNINNLAAGPREKKKELLNNPKRLDEIIRFGNDKARQRAQKTLEKMRNFMEKT